MDAIARCPVCADVIGVYEPVVLFGDGEPRTTSIARDPALHDSDAVIVHEQCAAAAGDGIREGVRDLEIADRA